MTRLDLRALRVAEPQQICGDLADSLHSVGEYHVILVARRPV